MSGTTSAGSAWDRRRWLILGVIGLAQLMVVLDLTVMNIALPSAQRALHFTPADRQWVVTAYPVFAARISLTGGANVLAGRNDQGSFSRRHRCARLGRGPGPG